MLQKFKKKSRQKKAARIIILSSKRMALRLLITVSNNQLLNDDWCEKVRVLYERKYKLPDRLTRAYDLASLVR